MTVLLTIQNTYTQVIGAEKNKMIQFPYDNGFLPFFVHFTINPFFISI